MITILFIFKSPVKTIVVSYLPGINNVEDFRVVCVEISQPSRTVDMQFEMVFDDFPSPELTELGRAQKV